jgi:hypothetical protein
MPRSMWLKGRRMARFRSHVTYANVIATLALFIALGGGAYAATKLPKNSVGSKQIKANAVNASKVADRSLLARDFKAGQLPAGAQGPQGIQGPKGDPCPPTDANCKGPKGDTGAGAAKFFATVDVSGSIVRGTQGVTGHWQGSGGDYVITFPGDVSNCVPLASETKLPNGILLSDHDVVPWLDPDHPEAAQPNPDAVDVAVLASSGKTQASFELAVFC